MPRTKFTTENATAATFDDVRAIQGNFGTVHVNGRSDLNDGYGGDFVVDELDQATADDNLDVLVTKRGLRYKRRTSRQRSPINVLDFMPLGVHARLLSNTNEEDLSGYFTKAVAELKGFGPAASLLVPRGWYFCPEGFSIPSTSSAYVADLGITIYGDYGRTIFTQNRRAAEDVVDYSDPTLIASQALIRVFGSNTVLRDLAWDGCVNPVYFGQDPNSAGSEVSACRLSRFIISRCGTAINQVCSVGPSTGTKKNTIDQGHIWQCQIAARTLEIGATTSNNNRQMWSHIYASRCNVAYWIENGDTNEFNACHAEGCHANVGSTPYELPAGTPNGLSYAWITGPDCLSNTMLHCVNESNDNDLYNGGGANRFIAGRFNPDKCTFVVSPLEFTAADNLRIDDQYSGLNTGSARTDTLSGYANGNQYNTRPLFVGAAAWGTPASGMARQVLALSSSSANPPLGAVQYGETSTPAEIAGIKTRSTTAGGVGALNSNDTVARFVGVMDDGVSNYVRGAKMEVVCLSAPSAANAQSAVRLSAVGSGVLTYTDVAQFEATQVFLGGVSTSSCGVRVPVVANAVARIKLSGNTSGNAVIIEAEGQTNVPITYATAGSSSHTFRTGGSSGPTQVSIDHTASADTQLKLTGANAANPRISTSNHNLWLGGGDLATSATIGYIMIPTANGKSTGVPDGQTNGQAALIWDRSNKKLTVYDPGAGWLQTVALT